MKKHFTLLTAAILTLGTLATISNAKTELTPPQEMISFKDLVTRETVSGNYLAGRFAQQQQDWGTAYTYLNRVLKTDPDNDDLKQRAMVLAMGAGKTDEAILRARSIVDMQPENELAILFLTADAFARQDYESVMTSLKTLPSKGQVAKLLQPVLMAWAKAANGELSINALNKNPQQAYHALMISDYLGQKGSEKPDLKPYLQIILSGGTIDVYELENIADILVRADQTKEAVNLYTLLKTQRPNDRDLAQKRQAVQDSQIPDEIAEASFVSSPAHGVAEAMFDMARILFRQFSDESAIVFSRMALHLNPDLTPAKVLLAQSMTRNEQLESAIDHYKSIPEQDPAYPDAQRSIANLLEQLERHNEAVSVLNHLFLSQKEANALIQIGDLYRRTEQYDKAIQMYNDVAGALGDALDERYWTLFYSRGIAYEQSGQWDQAEQDLEKALGYRPNNPYILNYLGYSWVDRDENLEKALDMIKKAVRLKPRDGFITDSLGWAYFRMEEYEKAVPFLERAVELEPYDPLINDHLGDAYWQVGRELEARFQWNRALNHAEDQDEDFIDTVKDKLENGVTEEVKDAKAQTIPDEIESTAAQAQ